jgi:hypothetical protein
MANNCILKDSDPGFSKLFATIKKIKSQPTATEIGIFAEKGSELVIYASTNEFGTDRAGAGHNIIIPERSFMRSTYEDCKRDIIKKIESIKIRLFTGNFDARQFFTEMGAWFKGKVQEKIAQGDFVPNAPSTLAAKAPKTHPLINRGRMRQSIAFRLVK